MPSDRSFSVLPVLLVIVFGVIEWGLYLYNRQVITNAAREGARNGVLMRLAMRDKAAEDTDIKNRVIDFAETYLITFGTDVLTADDVQVERDEDFPFLFGKDLTVNVEYGYDFLFLSLPPLSIGQLLITGEATMKME